MTTFIRFTVTSVAVGVLLLASIAVGGESEDSPPVYAKSRQPTSPGQDGNEATSLAPAARLSVRHSTLHFRPCGFGKCNLLKRIARRRENIRKKIYFFEFFCN